MEISIRSIERFSKLTDVQLHQPRRGASHLFDPIWSKLRKPVLSWTHQVPSGTIRLEICQVLSWFNGSTCLENFSTYFGQSQG